MVVVVVVVVGGGGGGGGGGDDDDVMRRGPLTGTVSRLSCLNHFKQRPIDVTSLRLSKSLYPRCAVFHRTNNCGSVFPNPLDRRIYVTKFPTHVSFLFPFSMRRITLTVPLTFRTALFLVTVAMLSRYSRNVESNCRHKVKYRYYCHTRSLEFM
jgi:hypothetical protein